MMRFIRTPVTGKIGLPAKIRPAARNARQTLEIAGF
jgi:hypothetical protein